MNEASAPLAPPGGALGHAALAELRRLLVAQLQRMLAPGVAEDQCEDFAQEALLRVHLRFPSFRGQGPIESWALTIALRVAFDEMKRARWRDVSYDAIGNGRPGIPEPRSEARQSTLLDRARVSRRLRELVDRTLTERQRDALLAGLDEVPIDEASRRLGVTRNALYKLEHDARRRVKKSLAAAGLSGEELLAVFE